MWSGSREWRLHNAHGRVGCVVSVVSVLSGMYCECGERAEWDVLGVW